MTPSITQSAIETALGNFLTAILPAATTVIIGQVNRVASPEGDYVVMWPLRRARLATNNDASADAKFIGSIDGTMLTITEVLTGALTVGSNIFGVGVAIGTAITGLGTGSGGLGTYDINNEQTVASGTISAGATNVKQTTQVDYQADAHGPSAADNVQVISTMFRDEYAVEQFAGTGITPLYAEDPRQLPFITAANQYEDRWSIDLHLEADPIVTIPQQYADAVVVDVIEVDATYPP